MKLNSCYDIGGFQRVVEYVGLCDLTAVIQDKFPTEHHIKLAPQSLVNFLLIFGCGFSLYVKHSSKSLLRNFSGSEIPVPTIQRGETFQAPSDDTTSYSLPPTQYWVIQKRF